VFVLLPSGASSISVKRMELLSEDLSNDSHHTEATVLELSITIPVDHSLINITGKSGWIPSLRLLEDDIVVNFARPTMNLGG